MSTLTKEWLLKTIAELEEERDATPGAVNENAAMALAAMKLALASLEAEAVAYMYKDNLHADARISLHTRFGNWSQEDINEYEITEIPLYAAPPAPVAVPDEVLARLEHEANHLTAWHHIDEHSCKVYRRDLLTLVNACRAAMLQGADGALTNEDTKRVGELVMLVKLLSHSLRKANPDSKLQSDAMDYLSRKGLIGVEDILR